MRRVTKRVLVVDDTPLNRKVAVAFLKRADWLVEEAGDGMSALDLLANDQDYDALLLDISMPGMSGEEVCRVLRADARTAGLPIVAYTAHALVDERERIMSAGFDGIVVKPASMADLLAALSAAVAKRSGA